MRNRVLALPEVRRYFADLIRYVSNNHMVAQYLL